MITEIEINGEVKRFIRIIRYLDGSVIGFTISHNETIILKPKDTWK